MPNPRFDGRTKYGIESLRSFRQGAFGKVFYREIEIDESKVVSHTELQVVKGHIALNHLPPIEEWTTPVDEQDVEVEQWFKLEFGTRADWLMTEFIFRLLRRGKVSRNELKEFANEL